MGGALLKGWLGAGLSPDNAIVVDPQNKAEGVKTFKEISSFPKSMTPKLIVLATKPQILPLVLKDIQNQGIKAGTVLSIAAGFKISKIEEAFPENTPVLRAMPNTPSAIGKGISGIFGNASTDLEDWALARGVLEACGPVVEVSEESLIDAVTAVSGSGPAYVFHLVEAMAKGGEAQGLSQEVAYLLARETIIGAGALLEESMEHAKTLRENVTSPGGTTEAALNILMEDGALVKLMKKAIKAAHDRGGELSEG